MIRVCMALLLLFPAVVPVHAQQGVPPVRSPILSDGSTGGAPVAMSYHPPLGPLQVAFDTSGLPWTYVNVMLVYGADGRAHEVRLEPSTGDAALDASIRTWVEASRVSPRRDRKSRPVTFIGFWFINAAVECLGADASGPDCVRDYTLNDFDGPLLKPVDISMLAMWGPDETDIEVYFEHDAAGRISRLAPTKRLGPIGASIWRGAESVRLKSMSPGRGRLHVRLVAVSDEIEAAKWADKPVELVWRTRKDDPRLLIDKSSVQEQLLAQQTTRLGIVTSDIVRVRIFHDASGVIEKVEPVAPEGQDAGKLREMVASILVSTQLKRAPGQAGTLDVALYPDGSVVPAD